MDQSEKLPGTILITGPTGNLGGAALRHLQAAAATNVQLLPAYYKAPGSGVQSNRLLNLDQPQTFAGALNGIHALFLMRPPQVADTDRSFGSLLNEARRQGLRHVVYISVQGAEKSRLIPHHRIEELIRKSGISYTIIRPSYFMQNLLGPIRRDILENDRIVLPAGNAVFNWLDTDNIGEVAAHVLLHPAAFQNRIIELTGTDNLTYAEVAGLLTEELGRRIRYQSRDPISFYFYRRRQGEAHGFTFVMTTIHFLQRFQGPTTISPAFGQILGRAPTSLRAFIERHAPDWRR